MWWFTWSPCLLQLTLQVLHHLPQMCTNLHWYFNIVGIAFRWFLNGFFVKLIHSFLGFHPFTRCPICPDYPLFHRFFQVLSVDTCPPSALSSPGSTCNRCLNRLSWLLFRRRCSRTSEPPPAHSCGHLLTVIHSLQHHYAFKMRLMCWFWWGWQQSVKM